MTEIKESRIIQVTGRVITLNDLFRLAKLLKQEAEILADEEDFIIFSITAESDDNSEFESADPNIFSEDSPILSKRIIAVKMRLWASVSGKSVDIDLRQTDSSIITYGNRISCKGSDSKWVNGMLVTVEDLINGFTPQNLFIKTNRKWIQPITAIGIGALILRIFAIALSQISIQETPSSTDSFLLTLIEQYPITEYIIVYFLFWIIGLFPSMYILERLKELWPQVELQVGPPHKHVVQRRRSFVIAVFLIGIVPFILQIIYDFIL